MKRSSGILCPVASLPSRFGVGDFGENAKKFLQIAKQSGFSFWQVLPLNPIGYGHSPYQPFSSFAIDEMYTDLDELAARGLIDKAPSFQEDADRIPYEEVKVFKNDYLHEAFKRETKENPHCIDDFRKSHPWVEKWALFMLNKRLENLQGWSTWRKDRKEAFKMGEPKTKQAKERYLYEIWLQMTLYRQWSTLRNYANSLGIKIIGDVPFYVGYDSCDVWANQEYFMLDKLTKEPAWIAGVPPDYFSATGQRWGNPIYNWKKLEKENFSFLIERLERNGELYDVIRLDHFRAFDTYWKIPASCPTAIDGEWVLAPGYRFFEIFQSKCPNIEIIAEDLGELRPHVDILRYHFDFPGMDVIQFTFEESNIKKKKKHDSVDSVVYVGTHDNDTAIGFFKTLDKEDQVLWSKALDEAKTPKGEINERLIHFAMNKNAAYVILTAQDILGLGNEGRINLPGVINSINWTWRMKDLKALESKVEELHKLNEEYNRL